MSKAHLTDFTGAPIYPGVMVAFATRRGNRVRQTVGVVQETRSDRKAGRVVPKLVVEPLFDSGFIGRLTDRNVVVGVEHAVVVNR